MIRIHFVAAAVLWLLLASSCAHPKAPSTFVSAPPLSAILVQRIDGLNSVKYKVLVTSDNCGFFVGRSGTLNGTLYGLISFDQIAHSKDFRDILAAGPHSSMAVHLIDSSYDSVSFYVRGSSMPWATYATPDLSDASTAVINFVIREAFNSHWLHVNGNPHADLRGVPVAVVPTSCAWPANRLGPAVK